MDNIDSEVNVLRSLKHANIVQFIGIKQIENDFYIVMEFMNNGNLLDYVRDNEERLLESQLFDMAIQIAEGMAYLESMRIIHK